MPTLNVVESCGTNRVSREHGRALRTKIEELWSADSPLVIDFGNVRIASVSFLDEGIAVLAQSHSLDEIRRRLRVVNINPGDRRLLNELLLARAREHESRTGELAPRP